MSRLLNCHEFYLRALLITLSLSCYAMGGGLYGKLPFARCKLVWLGFGS
jgi:hypothetical protein